MKKGILWTLLAAALVLARATAYGAENCSLQGTSAAVTPTCHALDAVTTTGASVWVNAAPYSEPSVQIWSAAGSVSQISLECTSDLNAPPYNCGPGGAPLINVTAGGVYWTLPRSHYYRVNVTNWTSGTISANFELYK